MISYIFYTIVFSIFTFVIYLAFRAVKEGINAKKELGVSKNEKSNNLRNNIIDKINEAEKLREKKIITKKEFEKIKNKLLKE